MPNYSSAIDRTGSQALMPEDASREIIQGAPQQSTVLRLARRLPNMTRAQQRMPVLSSLPTAYFVTGDTGLKQTSSIDWDNKYINAEELAVIVPIPEAVLDDSDYDMWGEVRPRIEEAIGIAIDAAILFGTNAPASWPDDIVTGAAAAANTIADGTNPDIYDDIMGTGGVLSLVEEDGFMVTGHIAALTMRAKLRGLRDSNGVPIFSRSMQDGSRYELDGQPIEFPRNGGFDTSLAEMISGDWSQLVYAIRQDITTKLLTEAVIQDGAGNIIYNLAQQDMVALRVVVRLGWQLPNPINLIQQTETDRYPFAILTP
jgi:HK97 family phage major capsid protein